MRQTALLVDLVDEAGFELTSPREPEIRGGSVVFRVPDFQAVHAELAAREIICDYRPDAGLRFGPHFFTTDDEIRFAVDQVREILDSDAHIARLAQPRASRSELAQPRSDRRRGRLVLVAHVDVRGVAHASPRTRAGRRRCTAARAGAGSGTARRPGRRRARSRRRRPTTRARKSQASFTSSGVEPSTNESVPSSNGPSYDDANRPQPVAERAHALEERRHPVEPRQRELHRELEPVGHRLGPAPELVGARQPVAGRVELDRVEPSA